MIRKYQTGGLVFFNAVANPYQIDPHQLAAASSSSSSKDDGLISKEIMNELYKKGIPVDVDKFTTRLANFERRLDLGLPVSKRDLYSLKAEANRIIQQASYLKDAEELADKNEAFGEVAVGSRGELFVTDKSGDIKKVSMQNYDIEKHGPALTVGELVTQRKFNPTQAFDFDITEVVGNNIGMQKINDYIKGIISTIGDSTTSQEAYSDLASLMGKGVQKPSQSEFETISRIAQEWETLGPDAIFKVGQTVGQKNLDAALQYILNALPRDMQIQLQGRSVAEGIKFENSGRHALELITSALAASNKTKIDTKIDYAQDINKRVNPTSNGGSSKTFYQTPLEAFFEGSLNKTKVTLSDNAHGNFTGIEVPGVTMPALTNDNGNAVSNLPLSIALNATLGKYLDYNTIYMGDEKVTEGKLQNIAYTQDKVAAIYMPVRPDGSIDWIGFHAFSEAEDEIKSKGITDPATKNSIHAKYNSYARYDQNGNIVPTENTERFLLTYGYTVDDNIDSSNNQVTELTGVAEDEMDEVLDAIYNKKIRKAYGISDMKHRNTWDDIFKVPVFIKISNTASADAYRYGGHGSSMTPRTMEQDMIQEQMQNAQRMQTSGSLLYQE